jgi:hypothetical protein
MIRARQDTGFVEDHLATFGSRPGEVPAQQVGGLRAALSGFRGAAPAVFAGSHQALLAHQRRGGVLSILANPSRTGQW